MIDPGQPMRHTKVVGVFRFEREVTKLARESSGKSSPISAKSAVGRDAPKSRVALTDQTQAYIAISASCFRRAKNRPDEVIVEVRRAKRELRLFARQPTVMM